MELAIICVNYNSYHSLIKYLASIEKAVLRGEQKNIVNIFIADNSTCKEDISSIYNGNLCVEVFPFDNLGYFGGALGIYNKIEKGNYDYIIISNVDLILKEDFFVNLNNKKKRDRIGWIAPSILSTHDGIDMNPKIVVRYSKRTIKLLRLMYKYPIIKNIYVRTLHKKKHNKSVADRTEREIYAGHGAMFIVTKEFAKKYNTLEYPVFLYGEEIFMGEMVRLAGLRTLYVPSIVVYDEGHVSTSTIKKKTNHKYNVEALTYLISRFYE